MSPFRRTPDQRKLPSHIIEQIIRLDEAGHKKTEIRRQTGVSRTAIYYILNGRPPQKLLQPPSEKQPADGLGLFDGPIERCPGCGRRVHMPCMPCRIESAIETEQRQSQNRRQRGV